MNISKTETSSNTPAVELDSTPIKQVGPISGQGTQEAFDNFARGVTLDGSTRQQIDRDRALGHVDGSMPGDTLRTSAVAIAHLIDKTFRP